jgi:RNA polymerase-interacting CarD/CdnL/TRCF family regulator
MPKIGDIVLYGSSGACCVTALLDMGRGEYYVLVPQNKQRTKVYVPKDSDELMTKMRPLPHKSDLLRWLGQVAHTESVWESDMSTRRERAAEVIRAGDEVGLMMLIKCFYEHRAELQQDNKKKFPVTDNQILHDAQERLFDEFSVVFCIDPSEVEDFILKRAHAS